MAKETQRPKSGTLNDEEIKELCKQNLLIVDQFDPERIKQACYELRASHIYYELPEQNRHVLVDAQYILIRPKQLVVIITKERLLMPDDILGRVLTKGKLFSVGLLPVNTYADPGFEGNLGIVLFNLSNDYLQIIPGQEIAKIEFSRLETGVTTRYKGQHGYESKMWPVPREMILSPEQIARDKRIGSNEKELCRAYGNDMGILINRVARLERWLRLLMAGFFIIALIFITLCLLRYFNTGAFIALDFVTA